MATGVRFRLTRVAATDYRILAGINYRDARVSSTGRASLRARSIELRRRTTANGRQFVVDSQVMAFAGVVTLLGAMVWRLRTPQQMSIQLWRCSQVRGTAATS